MNTVTLVGNVGKKPELKEVGDNKVVTFSLATSRKVKGETQTQWHSCVAWNKTAEVVDKYVDKGTKLGVIGEIVYRQYEKDGVKHTVTEILVNTVEFVGGASQEQTAQSKQQTQSDPFGGDDTGMPF